MQKMNLGHARLLYTRFTAIYGNKFVKEYSTDEFIAEWCEQWAESLGGISNESIRDALAHCRNNVEWPPSISEFKKYCDAASGMPSLDDAFASAIRKEFTHPVTYMAWAKVGSWAMSHDKDETLRLKFKTAYDVALTEYRANPEQAAALLERVTTPTPRLEAPNPPKSHEGLSFRERLAQWNEAAKADMDKMQAEGFVHPTWEKDKYTRGSTQFDAAYAEQRREYLVKLKEYESVTLEHDDRYDRIRYLRELDANEFLRVVGNVGGKEGAKAQGKEESGSKRKFNGTKTVFNNWMSD